MSRLLMNLRNVPNDELDEICTLLDSQGIGYYETSAGMFGIGLPALWVKADEQFATARALLDAYAVERAARVQHELSELRTAGRQRTVLDIFLEHPLRFLAYLVVIVAMFYVGTVAFWRALAA